MSFYTFAYTWSHELDNVSGFRQRNYQVPYYDENYFWASGDTDVRQVIVVLRWMGSSVRSRLAERPKIPDKRLELISDRDLAHRLSAGCACRTKRQQYRSRSGRRRRPQFGARRSGIAERSHLQSPRPAEYRRQRRQLLLQSRGILLKPACEPGQYGPNRCRGAGRAVHRRYAGPQCHSRPRV